MTSKNIRKPVKSELQLKMEAEGWTFISNVFCPTNPNDDIDSGENEDFFKGVRATYRFIKVTEAYNFEGHPLPQLLAVYGKDKPVNHIVA